MTRESACGAYSSRVTQLPTGEWDVDVNCPLDNCPLKPDDVPSTRRLPPKYKNEKEAGKAGVRITNYLCPVPWDKWFP